MSTRYFKDSNGQKMVIDDPIGMQYCPTLGFVECDANWQPLKPVVREWVSDMLWDKNRWRQEDDGPLMYLNDAGVWIKSDWNSVAEGMAIRAYEVHPGTRIPIDQPFPSSEPPVKAGPSVAYLDGKLNAVAEAVSGLLSRVENIEAELKRSGDETAKTFHDLAKVVNRHDADNDSIKAELHAMDDRIRDIDHKIDTYWQFRELRKMASEFNERLDAINAELADNRSRIGDIYGSTVEWRGSVAQRLDDIESNARRTDAVINELSGKMVAKSEPIHIQVASLIAVNQKLEAELRIVRKERDELLARVDSKPDVPDDPYPRTYRVESTGVGSGWDYFTFEASGSRARRYDPEYNHGKPWLRATVGEEDMPLIGAVRCPDPRAKQ